MQRIMLGAVLAISGCTFGLDRANVDSTPVSYTNIAPGSYADAAACTAVEIQRGDYSLQPEVQVINFPTDQRAEVQITASSGLTGTLFGGIVYFEAHEEGHRVSVRSPLGGDRKEAIAAVKRCEAKTPKPAPVKKQERKPRISIPG